MARKIVSIAAAPGWAARYIGEDDHKVVTLLAWALVEDGGGEPRLVGFVQRPVSAEHPAGTVVLADEVEGFDGYSLGALRTQSVDAH